MKNIGYHLPSELTDHRCLNNTIDLEPCPLMCYASFVGIYKIGDTSLSEAWYPQINSEVKTCI